MNCAALMSLSSVASFRLALPLALLWVPSLAAQAGAMDGTFGTGGVVLGNVNQEVPRGLAQQSTGCYVVAGRLGNPSAPFLRRHLADGSLDATFGNGGYASFSARPSFYVRAAAVDANDRVLVAGNNLGDYAVMRYAANGILDTSFGSGGIVALTGPHGYEAVAIAVQPDGRIVTSGTGSSGQFTLAGSVIIARFLATGALDTTFGEGNKKKGYTVVDLGPPSYEAALYHQLALFPNGSLVVGGTSNLGGSQSMLIRLNANGTRDAGFGNNGVLMAGWSAYSIAGQADGRILIGGTYAAPQSVRRLLANGAPDAGFGTAGVVDLGFPGTGNITAICVRADGRILINLAAETAPSTWASIPVQLLPGGTLDGTFGFQGFGSPVQVSGSNIAPTLGGMMIDSSGRLVGAGIFSDPAGQYFVMSRHQL